MPDDLSGDMFAQYGTKVPAVRAVNLGAAHLKGLPAPQYTLDALDQRTIARLVKDDHITSLDFSYRDWNPCREDIVAFAKIRPKAVTTDSKQAHHLNYRMGTTISSATGKGALTRLVSMPLISQKISANSLTAPSRSREV